MVVVVGGSCVACWLLAPFSQALLLLPLSSPADVVLPADVKRRRVERGGERRQGTGLLTLSVGVQRT